MKYSALKTSNFELTDRVILVTRALAGSAAGYLASQGGQVWGA